MDFEEEEEAEEPDTDRYAFTYRSSLESSTYEWLPCLGNTQKLIIRLW